MSSPNLSRREFTRLLGLGATLPFAGQLGAIDTPLDFRIRTITAGFQLQNANNLMPAKAAAALVQRARKAFEAEGYEVQTLRLASQPLQSYFPDWSSSSSLQVMKELDKFAKDNDVLVSIGPVITEDEYSQEFGAWAAEVVQQTTNINFSCQVASPTRGVHFQSLRSAAEAIHAITRASPGGEGNFRFAATGFVPSGTPFFPAAYFNETNAFSIGLESPNVLTKSLQGNHDLSEVRQRLSSDLEAALRPVAAHGRELAKSTGWKYLGIDASPAPGLDASIGQAIETMTNAPFGSPSTLAACATITDVLKGLGVTTCGYSGLMLPVLEDPVLAKRAAEGRYGVSELLLYSSVCGTGLDVVPLPGDTSVDELTAVIRDVAALATKYQKPLSARLFPIPGKQTGEKISFDNPYLTDSVVMALQ